ncbi:MAG: sensor domain-containing diguanylate cyclase [Pseudomonadales bacterium]|nr:sensor domain-containing diguanylate cyclase [Pseudomonadales bacterium]NRA16140.1 sensor domain-containing diguanylate cyclase [Oceanospirillaceae bacterium]
MNNRILQQENLQLKKTLQIAVKEAQRNEEILKRFMDIEVQMLACGKLSQLINLLLVDFKNIFKLSVVTIYLHNKDELAESLLQEVDPALKKHLHIVQDLQFISEIFPTNTIRAGELNRQLRKQLFPDNPFILSSVLLPLINKNRLIGSLHLGARELNRYHSDYRYDYLERLAALLAVCIENCIIQENLAYLSSTDTLTKLYNRHSFDLEIDKALQRASRRQQPLSLLFLDIDHFKQVNDNYGHSGGDAILKAFAKILKNQIRNTDFLARFGGEEFAILLPECEPEQAAQISNNLRAVVAEHFFDTGTVKDIKVTTSIGVSSYLPGHTDIQSFSELASILLQTSDQALYQAKFGGRNKVVYKAIPLPTRQASCR